MTTLNRAAYQRLIDEDLAWLESVPRTLERDHVIHIVKWSLNHEYPSFRADALAPPEPGWQPIATCPRDVEVIFWLVPKTAEESYADTSGHPIISTHAGYWKRGSWLSWGALSKPTHWRPDFTPPRADALDARKENS